jgi:hypothetical protein
MILMAGGEVCQVSGLDSIRCCTVRKSKKNHILTEHLGRKVDLLSYMHGMWRAHGLLRLDSRRRKEVIGRQMAGGDSKQAGCSV